MVNFQSVLMPLQYMDQPNQGYSRNLTEDPFWDVNTLGQTYGLEPNYPCCTVNHPQGYPKFLSASFVAAGDNGLGHALLSPAQVTTTLSQSNTITVSCTTNYPFDTVLDYAISATAAFDFYVRVPSWTTSSSISMAGQSVAVSPDSATGMTKISIPSGSTTLTYTLGADLVIETRANDTVAIHHGALLYALAIGEDTTDLPPKAWDTKKAYPSSYAPSQCQDHEINNLTAWNIAIDPSTLTYVLNSTNGSALANPIWSAGAPPNQMIVTGCEIAWPIQNGVPANPPADRTCVAPAANYTLVPYGSAKLHMSELPTVNLTSSSG